jgi:hypothetical protein
MTEKSFQRKAIEFPKILIERGILIQDEAGGRST